MDFTQLFQPAIITSAGGIVLAILLAYFLYKFASNHVNHNTEAMKDVSKNLAVNTEVSKGLSDVIRTLIHKE